MNFFQLDQWLSIKWSQNWFHETLLDPHIQLRYTEVWAA